MTYIARHLESDIKARLFSGKAIIVYGPRQCGKTTMLRHITEEWSNDVLWLNGDSPDTRDELERVTIARWKLILGKKKILVLDEAQRVSNVGLALKLLIDELPEIQVIASGSSSFELADKTSEPLTGRKFEYRLLPFSFHELTEHDGLLNEKQALEQRLLYGAYPDIVTHPEDSERLLSELVNSYLFKDIYALEGLKKTKILDNLGCVVNRFVLYYANVKKKDIGKMANAYERHDISDESWAKIEFLLPGRKGTWGGNARDNRQFINAVFWILRTGAPWRDLPPSYGDWKNTHRRFCRWRDKGVWEKLLQELIDNPEFELLMIDASHIKVHAHGSGARGGNQDMAKTKGGSTPRYIWPWMRMVCRSESLLQKVPRRIVSRLKP